MVTPSPNSHQYKPVNNSAELAGKLLKANAKYNFGKFIQRIGSYLKNSLLAAAHKKNPLKSRVYQCRAKLTIFKMNQVYTEKILSKQNSGQLLTKSANLPRTRIFNNQGGVEQSDASNKISSDDLLSTQELQLKNEYKKKLIGHKSNLTEKLSEPGRVCFSTSLYLCNEYINQKEAQKLNEEIWVEIVKNPAAHKNADEPSHLKQTVARGWPPEVTALQAIYNDCSPTPYDTSTIINIFFSKLSNDEQFNTYNFSKSDITTLKNLFQVTSGDFPKHTDEKLIDEYVSKKIENLSLDNSDSVEIIFKQLILYSNLKSKFERKSSSNKSFTSVLAKDPRFDQTFRKTMVFLEDILPDYSISSSVANILDGRLNQVSKLKPPFLCDGDAEYLEQIVYLDDGAYELSFGTAHSTALFINTENGTKNYYFHDPEIGMIKCNSEKPYEAILQVLTMWPQEKKYVDNTGNFKMDHDLHISQYVKNKPSTS